MNPNSSHPSPDRSDSISDLNSGSGPELCRTRIDLIEGTGRLCQLLGLPRSIGRIYGLMYLSINALSLDDVVAHLGISKASASNGTRQLLSWGAIRQVWVQGERKDYFEVVADLGTLLRARYSDFLKPRLDSTGRRLEVMLSRVDEELASGMISAEEHKLFGERLRDLADLQKKINKAESLAMRFL